MKQILSLLLFYCSVFAYAQQPVIVFKNTATNKVIKVKPGNTLSIQYNGYMGQSEQFKQLVTDINDSMVTLGYPQSASFLNAIDKANGPKQIRIADITRFRKMTTGRQLVKALLKLSTAVGTYILAYNLAKLPDLSTGELLLYTLSVGMGSATLVEVAFPEHPKYFLKDGWEVSVIHE